MGKAERNRRKRQQRQPSPEERLRREGQSGPLPGDSAEARALIEQVNAETEMPCRAVFLDDPLFADSAHATVTGMTPEGDLATDGSSDPRRVPVLLFEPVHVIAFQDSSTGLPYEARTTLLVGAGWQRPPARFVIAGLPADGWGLYRTATGVKLVDPYGGIYAEGRLDLDPEWVSAAVSAGGVLVLVGPKLGIRVPPDQSPESYADQDRVREFRAGRRDGLLAAATVQWHTGPPTETMSWVLLREGTLGPSLPPVAYVPQLNLKPRGGPQAFGLASLAAFGLEPMEIPATHGMVAKLTETDVDLHRPGTDLDSYIAGYRNPGGPGDERFAEWRASAARHGRILVVTGSRNLLPGEKTTLEALLDVVRSSHGAVVPLTPDSVPPPGTGPPSAQAKASAGHDEQAAYSELLTNKLRGQKSYEIHFATAVADLIDPDTLQRWLVNMWPVTCLTCAEPLGSKADLSADQLGGGELLLSLHHSACRPSSVTATDEPVTMYHPTASFVAGYLGRPGRGPGWLDIPVLVVNPSCEQLLLARDAGGWRNATLDGFTALGMSQADGSFPPVIAQIHATMLGDQLDVTVEEGMPVRHEWPLEPPPHVAEQLRRCHGFAISLTTKVLPALLVPDDLPAAFADPEAITGWAELDPPPHQRRRWPILHRAQPAQAQAPRAE
jgi:hypothetical protein